MSLLFITINDYRLYILHVHATPAWGMVMYIMTGLAAEINDYACIHV